MPHTMVGPSEFLAEVVDGFTQGCCTTLTASSQLHDLHESHDSGRAAGLTCHPLVRSQHHYAPSSGRLSAESNLTDFRWAKVFRVAAK